jgi:hypothetical protein
VIAAPFVRQPASDHITDLRADIANVRLDELRTVGKHGAPTTQREALQDSPFGDGKILIESKDDMRKRLGGAIGSSPDRADALCLAIDTTQQAVWFDDDPINPFERY